jgi:parallel beta-helix repeat protein
MKRSQIISVTLCLAICSISFATVVHVPSEYETIQAGINATIDGDTVLVAAGEYPEHFSYNGRNIVVLSESGPENTIIQMADTGRAIVSFVDNEDNDAVLEGFTVRSAYLAAGIYTQNASPTIIGNIFLDNYNTEHGGAISSFGGCPIVTNNYFEGNISIDLGGGAVFSYQGRIVVINNVFYRNYAPYHHGGAIHIFTSDKSWVHHNLFYQNSCLALGGAVVLSVCNNSRFYNNTVVDNSDIEAHGAGVAVWYSNNCYVYNNIIIQNNGIGIHHYPVNDNTFAYNDVWTNSINYDGAEPGDGSISADPLFVGGDPFSFHLTFNSPCIDAGDPTSEPDPDGTIADMGAYYYDQQVGIADGWHFNPREYFLKQNFPNPFNASTNIEFNLPEASHVSLEIFDSAGRKVTTVIDGQYAAGEHRVIWDGCNEDGNLLSSGVYFYELKSPEGTSSKSMLMLK